MAKKASELLRVPVTFGSISIGDETAKVSFAAERDVLDVGKADELLCGKRLTGELITGQDDPKQRKLAGMEERHRMTGTFDCKSFRATPKRISTGATFVLESINIEKLGHFAKKPGWLIVTDLEELVDGKEDDETVDPA